MIAWQDVTEWTTLWSPQDDVQAPVLAELERAVQAHAQLFSTQYSVTIPQVFEAFTQLAPNASVFVFDRSQAEGHEEREHIEAFCRQVPSSQWAIGESSEDEILHAKVLAILYPDGSGWTFSGSYNLSESAQRELNVVDLVRSRSRAEAFAQVIQAQLERLHQTR